MEDKPEEAGINPADFENIVVTFLGHMGFGVDSKTIVEDGLDIIAKTTNPLGGNIPSFIRARMSASEVGEDEIQGLWNEAKKQNALRAAFITTADFTSAAKEFAKDKPISLINRYELADTIHTYGLDTDTKLISILEKTAITERYFKSEKYSFIADKSRGEVEAALNKKSTGGRFSLLRKKKKLKAQVNGRYAPVGVFDIRKVEYVTSDEAPETIREVRTEFFTHVNLNSGELYYVRRKKPRRLFGGDRRDYVYSVEKSDVLAEVLELPPESKEHLLDLMDHGSLPYDELKGKHLSILEKKGMVEIHEKTSSGTRDRLLRTFSELAVKLSDELLDLMHFGAEYSPKSKPSEIKPKEEGKVVSVELKMPHLGGGIYNIQDYLLTESGIDESFRQEPIKYQSSEVARILKSAFRADVGEKGVMFLPYYHCRYFDDEGKAVKHEKLITLKFLRQYEQENATKEKKPPVKKTGYRGTPYKLIH